MTELPPATTRRELRERERAAEQAPEMRFRREKPSRARRPERLAPDAGRHPRVSPGKRVLSAATMLFVGALAIGLSVPSNLFGTSGGDDSAAALAASASGTATTATAGQDVSLSADQTVDATTPDSFAVKSWAQLLAQQYGHVSSYQFTGGAGTVRWPFPYAVPISSPYGPRVAPCAGCSTFHNGVDFTPGKGAPIYAIADGVVTGREDGTSEYGNYVILTHQIGGHTVTSTYAHMLTGSSPMVMGQTVKVGDFLGLTGATGEATGPHLHFEIAVDGVRTDPIPWLTANVN